MSRQIEREPVQTYRAHWRCPQEGCDGEMLRSSHFVLTSNPPQYPHKCDECGHTANASGKSYPRIEHGDAHD